MSQSNYSALDKLLHSVALASPTVISAACKVDAMTTRVDSARATQFGEPVFISGMARSGTTMLLDLCLSTGAFHSQSYRDMPFVTAPNLWNRVSMHSWKESTIQERAHGDGLEISFDSVEAFEEVFWRGLLQDSYIEASHLIPQENLEEEEIEGFRRFVAQVLESGPKQRRYLSKNNNNLLRLGTLRRAFPNAPILVPFRDPESFVASVLRQHNLFMDLHTEDPFSRKYMRWLGHFEFGLDFRPQLLPGVPIFSGNPRDLDQDYLYSYWTRVHKYLLGNASLSLTFLDHANLRAVPEQGVKALSQVIGIDKEIFDVHRIRQGYPVSNLTLKNTPELEAWRVYSDLKLFAINAI